MLYFSHAGTAQSHCHFGSRLVQQSKCDDDLSHIILLVSQCTQEFCLCCIVVNYMGDSIICKICTYFKSYFLLKMLMIMWTVIKITVIRVAWSRSTIKLICNIWKAEWSPTKQDMPRLKENSQPKLLLWNEGESFSG